MSNIIFFFPGARGVGAFNQPGDEETRRATILEALAEFLGPKALDPRVFYLSDFGAEEWTRGAYATSYDLGGLHRWGPFQNDPVGPIHFASSDIAAEGYQHVDGAVLIGTATWALEPTMIQPPGKKMMNASDWARGMLTQGTEVSFA